MGSQNVENLYKLAYDLSQAKIASQASSAIGADSRAMSFSGLCVTSSALLLGLAGESIVPTAMIIGALLISGAAALAGYSARPIKFFFPGANFSDLEDDIQTDREICKVFHELGSFSQKHITANNDAISKNSNLLDMSYRLAILGIFAAALPQLVLFFQI